MEAVFVLMLVLAGFILTKNLPFTAMVGAVLMILVSGKKPALVFERLDWTLLVFFASLFIVVGGVAKSGLPQALYDTLAPYLGGDGMGGIAGFSLFSAAVSNLVSNVPYVVLVVKWIPSFANPKLMWLVLAMASTFAGNLTIMGSDANMIVMELSKEDVKGPRSMFSIAPIGVARPLARGG